MGKDTWFCTKCNDEHFYGSPCPKLAVVQVSQLNVQVDGDHYKKLKIQPAKYSWANNLSWHQGEIIKYITRYKDKNGKADLEKARHLIDMLIEFEYDSS